MTTLSNSLRMLFSRVGTYPPGTTQRLDSDAFSPNTAASACPECHWLGTVYRVSESSLVPDPSLSIREGAIAAWPGRVVERLYGNSGELNDAGQSSYYGKVGGVIVTGNEDGIKHVAMNVLYSLQHLGYTIPPQADAGWIGEAGPDPSYLDEGSGGPQNDFTRRNTTIMTWNLMHVAAMLRAAGGIPSRGNDRNAWAAGARFDHPNPECR
ncbi:hypothetical protein [Pseudonocardia sp.]|uniref:flavodoxin family protein n=1 Tax=Pseudonocardia sp. TaxID=60912 RepID=UPI0026368B08|nr:hypothetical protein [Pseudonocardia sp.]